MKKYRLWFILSVGFLSLLGADAAFFVLTGMTLFDPDKNLQVARYTILGGGSFIVALISTDGCHIKKE